MAAAKTAPDVYAQLREPFPASMVKKNQDNLDYVPIDGYINRLIDVLGPKYDFIVDESTVELLPAEIKTSTGKRQYLARVRGHLSVYDLDVPGYRVMRAGVGADISFDPDKALKTAQAEALKKASHQFGIALELWNEEHRKSLDKQRRLANATPAALKQEVWKIAKDRLGKDKPTAAQIAKVFGVKPGELGEESVLRGILEQEGVL